MPSHKRKPTIQRLIHEAIFLVCDRNGIDRNGKYRFTRSQLITHHLDNIEAAATRSRSKDLTAAIGYELTHLCEVTWIRRIGHGEYELTEDLGVFYLINLVEDEPRHLPG